MRLFTSLLVIVALHGVHSACTRKSELIDPARVIYSVQVGTVLIVSAVRPCFDKDSSRRTTPLEPELLLQKNVQADIERACGVSPFKIVALAATSSDTPELFSRVAVISRHKVSNRLRLCVTLFEVAIEGTKAANMVWFDNQDLGAFPSDATLKLWQSRAGFSPNAQHLVITLGPFLAVWERNQTDTRLSMVSDTSLVCAPQLLNNDLNYVEAISWSALDFSHDGKYFALGASNLVTLQNNDGLDECNLRQPTPDGLASYQGEIIFIRLANESFAANATIGVLQHFLSGIAVTSIEIANVLFDHLNTTVFFNVLVPESAPDVSQLLKDIGRQDFEAAALLALHQSSVVNTTSTFVSSTFSTAFCLSGPGLAAATEADLTTQSTLFFGTQATVNAVSITDVTNQPNDLDDVICATVSGAVASPQFRLNDSVAKRLAAAFVSRTFGTQGTEVELKLGTHTLEVIGEEVDRNFVVAYEVARLLVKRDCNMINTTTSSIVDVIAACVTPVKSIAFAPEYSNNVAVLAYGTLPNGVVLGLVFRVDHPVYIGIGTDNRARFRAEFCDFCDLAVFVNRVLSEIPLDQCQDRDTYFDVLGHNCAFWRSQPSCQTTAAQLQMSDTEISEVLDNCRLACGQCVPRNSNSGLTGSCALGTLTCDLCLQAIAPPNAFGQCARDDCFDQNVGVFPIKFREACESVCQQQLNQISECTNAQLLPPVTSCQDRIQPKVTKFCPFTLDLVAFRRTINISLKGTLFAWGQGLGVLSRIGNRINIFTFRGSVAQAIVGITHFTPLLTLQSDILGAEIETLFKVKTREDVAFATTPNSVILVALNAANPPQAFPFTAPYAFGSAVPLRWTASPLIDSVSHVTIPAQVFSRSSGTFSVTVTLSNPTDTDKFNVRFEPQGVVRLASTVVTIPKHEYVLNLETITTQGSTVLSVEGLELAGGQVNTTLIIDRQAPRVTLSLPDLIRTRPGCDGLTNEAVTDLILEYSERVQPQCFDGNYKSKVGLDSQPASRTVLQVDPGFVDNNLESAACGGLTCDPFSHDNKCQLILATTCDECSINISVPIASVLDLAQNENTLSPSVILCVDRVPPLPTVGLLDSDGNAASLLSAPVQATLVIDFDEPILHFDPESVLCQGCTLATDEFSQPNQNIPRFTIPITFKSASIITLLTGAQDLAGNSNLVQRVGVKLAPIVLQVSSNAVGAMTVISVLLLLVIVGLGVLTYLHRGESEIRQRTPVLSELILTGLAMTIVSNWMLNSAMAAKSQTSRDRLCDWAPGVQVTAIALFLGALVARNYRVWRVIDNPALREMTIRTSEIATFATGFVIVIASLVVWWGRTEGSQSGPAHKGRDSYIICNVKTGPAFFTISALLIAMYVMGGYMIFRILILAREAGFNESKAIAFAFYNIAFVLIAFALVRRSLSSADDYLLLASFCQFWFVICTIVALFLPPLYRLFKRKRGKKGPAVVHRLYESSTEMSLPNSDHSATRS